MDHNHQSLGDQCTCSICFQQPILINVMHLNRNFISFVFTFPQVKHLTGIIILLAIIIYILYYNYLF